MRREIGAVPRLLAATHALREDLLHDPCQSNHANYISGSGAAHIAAEDGLESICDRIQAWRSGNFGIPVEEVVVAVLLRLWDVEDLVLVERYEKRPLPAVCWKKTYKIWHWDCLIY